MNQQVLKYIGSAKIMSNAFIALGTNIEPREEHFNQAIESLKTYSSIHIVQMSSIYETKPVGYTEQADFLNMVVQVQTDFTPFELLDICQQIEQQLGRKRTIRFGPRSIDLDVLLFNNNTIDTETLTIPHPRMHERAFVLIPLQEIEPNLKFKGASLKEWLNQLSKKDVEDVRIYKKAQR